MSEEQIMKAAVIAGTPVDTQMGVDYLKRKVFFLKHGMSPYRIAESFDLAGICRFFKANGCEAIVPGCSHFPWFKNEVSALTDLPVIDPADIMYDCLIGQTGIKANSKQKSQRLNALTFCLIWLKPCSK